MNGASMKPPIQGGPDEGEEAAGDTGRPRSRAGRILGLMAAVGFSLAMWAFIAIRWAGASLVVPFMEELFWRDYLWRTISAPADMSASRVPRVTFLPSEGI